METATAEEEVTEQHHSVESYMLADHERRIQSLERFQLTILLSTIGTLVTALLTLARTIGHG